MRVGTIQAVYDYAIPGEDFIMREIITSIEGEFRRYKKLGDESIAQLHDQELIRSGDGGNSVAILVWHLSGNLKSRFTDFLTSDGEKPWRNRDEEFRSRTVTRAELMAKWDEGWTVLFKTLGSLTDEDLFRTVVIRGETFTAHETLHRLLAHAAYHTGQIVYIAKGFRAGDWKCLSIPLGKSDEFNRNPKGQRP
jgi:uncharacterized damage-inducible protein DinB